MTFTESPPSAGVWDQFDFFFHDVHLYMQLTVQPWNFFSIKHYLQTSE